MTHRYEHFIYETYLDSFGHVNNAKYMEFYEQARWDWLDSAGVTIEDINKTGTGLVVLSANISYIKELKPRQKIYILTEAVSYIRKIFTVSQEMRLSTSDDLISKAEFRGGLFDLKQRKLVTPDEEWIKRFDVEWQDN